jgi:hypothetical protein
VRIKIYLRRGHVAFWHAVINFFPFILGLDGRYLGANLKIVALKIGTNKINGLGTAENRCKNDRA